MAEGMEGGERAGSMPAGQLDYLSGIPSPTPSELTDAANMLNDLMFVSSVLLLVAVIAKVVVANVILRQRAEVERLFKMRQQVCSDAKLSQQRTQSTVGIRVFYERRKTDVMAEARQALRVTVLYEEREAAIEILDSQNYPLISQAGVKDVIISNRLVSMILAQVSESRDIKHVYDDIFAEEGSEIYLKPASLYFESFPMDLSFADMIQIAQDRKEVCFGLKLKANEGDSEQNYGIQLIPEKNQRFVLNAEDSLVVLAEDES